MAIKTEKLPYEILVRFGDDGKVRGAHVIWAYKVTDGDKVVSYQPGTAEPAGEGRRDFPLADAVTAALADGLRANMDLTDKIMKFEQADIAQEHQMALKDRRIAELKAEVAELYDLKDESVG